MVGTKPLFTKQLNDAFFVAGKYYQNIFYQQFIVTYNRHWGSGIRGKDFINVIKHDRQC